MMALLFGLLLAGPMLPPFIIQVVDAESGKPVPLVELRTTNQIRYVSDNAGIIAFDEPSLMGTEVHFAVHSHGYDVPKDGFGFRGVRLTPKHGSKAVLKVNRQIIAERVARVTGDGLYAESAKAGLEIPFNTSGKNARVLGCDSVFMTPYQNRLFWIWGDTLPAKYPLGNFHTTAARTPLTLNPNKPYQFDYLDDGKGFVKPVAKMPGNGPTWIESLVTLKNKEGQERLWGEYAKVDSQMKVHARGLLVFDDKTEQFLHHLEIPLTTPILPVGHSFRFTENGTEYLVFGNPFPRVRVPATEAAFTDPKHYEAFTCLKSGSTLAHPEIDRDDQGQARYRWRKNAPPLTPEDEAKLLKQKILRAGEPQALLKDRTGSLVILHRGSVRWNAYRKKWILIANQIHGKESFLGEVWYAEAASPTGPWSVAVKILTHDRKDFYNPCHHPEFDRDNGKIIYWEGTYTNTFSGNPDQTPRYEYNQILYRLDLSDKRLRD
jgi:hypothetical protein